MASPILPDDVSPEQVVSLFQVADLAGVFANAILGAVLARANKLDLIGMLVLAIVSGLGGGMIRDVLLQQGPPVALTNYSYLLTAMVAAVIIALSTIEETSPRWSRVLNVIDAIAVGTWAAAGALKTLEAGLGWLPAIMLGAITATGGGVVRDVLMNRVPSILGGLHGTTLYATSAIVASAAMVQMYQLGLPNWGLVVSTIVGGGLVQVARWRNWMLPVEYEWVWRKPARAGLRLALAGGEGLRQLSKRPSKGDRVADQLLVDRREKSDLSGLVKALKKTYAASGYPVQGVSRAADFLSLGEHDVAWTARVGKRVVGHVALTVPREGSGTQRHVREFVVEANPRDVRLVSRLFVDPDYQGNGASSVLLDMALAQAARDDAVVMLNCMDKDQIAMAMYERRGAVRVGRTTQTLLDGSRMPCWWYQFGVTDDDISPFDATEGHY